MTCSLFAIFMFTHFGESTCLLEKKVNKFSYERFSTDSCMSCVLCSQQRVHEVRFQLKKRQKLVSLSVFIYTCKKDFPENGKLLSDPPSFNSLHIVCSIFLNCPHSLKDGLNFILSYRFILFLLFIFLFVLAVVLIAVEVDLLLTFIQYIEISFYNYNVSNCGYIYMCVEYVNRAHASKSYL